MGGWGEEVGVEGGSRELYVQTQCLDLTFILQQGELSLLSRSTLDLATVKVLQYCKLTSYYFILMLRRFFFFFDCKINFIYSDCTHTKISVFFQIFFNCPHCCSENSVGTEWKPLGLAADFGRLIIKG